MRFQRARIQNFRNFETLEIELNPRVNIFIGPNGQGKTNLLEALYLVSHGKSFRPATNETLISNKPSDIKNARVYTVFHNEIHDTEVEGLLGPSKKTFYFNKKPVSSSVLVKNIPIVLFSPESLSAVKEGPEVRRELIDELIVITNHENAKLLADFTKVLRTRNRILKAGLQNEYDSAEFERLLNSINDHYFAVATELTLARTKSIQTITSKMTEVYAQVSGQNEVEIAFEYLISGENALKWDRVKVQNSMISRSQVLASAERESGTSLIGPHKHDIRVILNGFDSRYFSSQGQQRALILSFKIAQIMHHKMIYGTYPVLLLDDVLSELDEEKRFFLVRFLKGIDTQTLVTSTEISHFEALNEGSISVYEVSNGTISRKSI